jgi:hypothetical protein
MSLKIQIFFQYSVKKKKYFNYLTLINQLLNVIINLIYNNFFLRLQYKF